MLAFSAEQSLLSAKIYGVIISIATMFISELGYPNIN
jgi:hypothetical protein